MTTGFLTRCPDPMAFARLLWPKVNFYDKQRGIIYSVRDNVQTFAPAGNMLGKDFVAGFIVLWFFFTRVGTDGRRGPCRIVTTSATDRHLNVLWGEIRNFIQTAAHPLMSEQGGPLIVNDRKIRWTNNGVECPLSYVEGLVANDQSLAAMQGHHIADVGDGVPRTLFVSDESSSVQNEYWTMADTWMQRALVLGNTWPCENFFKYAVKGRPGTTDKGGDIPRRKGGGFLRKVIHICAEDSPNVKFARQQIAAGIEPTGEIIVPGVKPWDKYQDELLLWNDQEKTVKHKAQFYEGASVRLFPRAWLDRAELMAQYHNLRKTPRRAKGMGVDPAEGGDKTAIAVVDEYGLLDLVYGQTPNTALIKGQILMKMKEWNLDGTQVAIDRSGGGKQIADDLREMGHGIRTVSFGEGLIRDIKEGGGMVTQGEKREERDVRYTYKNRRAQMFGKLRELMDPGDKGIDDPTLNTFALPHRFHELRAELEPIPLTYDGEGMVYLIPKYKPNDKYKGDTLTDLIGHSPDLADATVLAIYAMMEESGTFVATAF